MPNDPVTEILPHDEVLLIAIRRRSLDDVSTQTMIDDIHTAASARPGVPIVLDMSEVKFAPSVALGSLAHLTKSFKFDRRRIALVGIDPRVRGTISVTQLDRLLEIHDTLEQVLKG